MVFRDYRTGVVICDRKTLQSGPALGNSLKKRPRQTELP